VSVHRAVVVTLALAVGACSVDRTGLAELDGGSGPTDASSPMDALRDVVVGIDSGRLDSGGIDAARRDGALDDAGPGDAGPSDAGPNDAGSADAGSRDGGCTFSSPRCVGGSLERCVAGAPVTAACPLGCATADRCWEPLPSNVPETTVDPSAPPMTLGTDVDTDACALGTVVAQTSAPQLCVLVTGSFTVAASATVTVRGARPLVVIASGAIRIQGTLDASAVGVMAGPGGGGGGTRASPDGGGLRPGARGLSSTVNNADGGGGGGGLCGAGGAGGTGQSTSGGAGGTALTGWDLSPLQGGSGGGWARGTTGPPDTSADGGAGGGAIQLFSTVSIDVGGRILVGGGGGRGGLRHPNPSVNYGAGAGGGSGGAVLLEAPTVRFGGSATISASGGGGGGGADDLGDAGPGQDGRDATGRAFGGASGGPRFGSTGGQGGADASHGGLPGGSNTMTYANGAGGGGGVGCIVVRNATGTLPSGTTSFSPRTGPALSALTIRAR